MNVKLKNYLFESFFLCISGISSNYNYPKNIENIFILEFNNYSEILKDLFKYFSLKENLDDQNISCSILSLIFYLTIVDDQYIKQENKNIFIEQLIISFEKYLNTRNIYNFATNDNILSLSKEIENLNELKEKFHLNNKILSQEESTKLQKTKQILKYLHQKLETIYYIKNNKHSMYEIYKTKLQQINNNLPENKINLYFNLIYFNILLSQCIKDLDENILKEFKSIYNVKKESLLKIFDINTDLSNVQERNFEILNSIPLIKNLPSGFFNHSYINTMLWSTELYTQQNRQSYLQQIANNTICCENLNGIFFPLMREHIAVGTNLYNNGVAKRRLSEKILAMFLIEEPEKYTLSLI